MDDVLPFLRPFQAIGLIALVLLDPGYPRTIASLFMSRTVGDNCANGYILRD
jgi:hypothetical protein